MFLYPQRCRRTGVRTQLIDAARINFMISKLRPPQMRFFQEKSKGSVDSDHCNHAHCSREWEWMIRASSKKETAVLKTSFLLSFCVGFGLKLPKPRPLWLSWAGNLRSKSTFSNYFWNANEKLNIIVCLKGSLTFCWRELTRSFKFSEFRGNCKAESALAWNFVQNK